MDENDDSSTFLDVSSINIESTSAMVISELNFINSTLSFSNIQNIMGSSTELKTLIINGISFTDTYFPNSRTLMSFEDIFTESNFTMQLSQIKFENIQFESTGILINFEHQLIHTVVTAGLTVNNVSSGVINVMTHNTNNEVARTMIQIVNGIFQDTNLPSQSLITASRGAFLGISSSNFSKFSTINEASGLFNCKTEAIIDISNSEFQQNSAVTSSLFTVENDGLVKCTT